MERESVIVSAARTPFGRFGGALRDVPAVELGAISIREAVKRAGISGDQVDMVIMGQVLQGGVGQIPSRQASIKAGLPYGVYSDTINKVCISGLRAVTMADQIIKAGDADIIVAGGMESMSNAPYFVREARWGARMNRVVLEDLMVWDGLWCAFYDRHMALHGNEAGKEFGITREEMDAWALRSHQRAIAAIDKGLFKEEIVPVEVPKGKGPPAVVDTDEGPRRDTSLEKLQALPPIFVKDGLVTAGNAPGVNDGAGALVVMSRQKANELGIKPLAVIRGHASVSDDPKRIYAVPGLAANKLLNKLGMTIDQMDLIENNEAFAAVTLSCAKITGWDPEKVNVNGGAIALGHPIGASGARILMTLIFELRRRGGKLGLACICGGAAQGEAIIVEIP